MTYSPGEGINLTPYNIFQLSFCLLNYTSALRQCVLSFQR